MTQIPRFIPSETARRMTLDAEPWLSCDDCFYLMDQYVEELLRDEPLTESAMTTHLLGCSACLEEAIGLLCLISEDWEMSPERALGRLPARS